MAVTWRERGEQRNRHYYRLFPLHPLQRYELWYLNTSSPPTAPPPTPPPSLVVFGGTGAKKDSHTISSDVTVFNWRRKRWEGVPPCCGSPHPATVSASSVAVGDAIVFFGGVDVANGSKSLSVVSVLNCRTWLWTRPPIMVGRRLGSGSG